MNHARRTLGVVAALLAVAESGCSGDAGTSGGRDLDVLANHGERGRGEAAEARRGESEESGSELALDATYDEVRNGVRLVLAYDAGSNAFSGTLENTTDEPLAQVRVEVHLSDGTELGPTAATDLGAGEAKGVTLLATGGEFDGWSAHAEVGNEEHDDHEEGEAHDREGPGEHGSG